MQLIAAAVISCIVVFGTSASANTITVTPDAGAGNSNPVTVSGDFVGLVTGGGAAFLAGTVSTTAATGFVFSGNEAETVTLLNGLTGSTFAAIGSNTDFDDISGTSGDSEVGTFPISADYFAIKADGWIAFFHKLGVGQITVSYDAINDPPDFPNGAGISHILALSHVNGGGGGGSPVPGPVVGAGLPGLLIATGVLLVLGRWRRRKLAA